MRILLVYCHPCPESFVAAVRDAALRGLAGAGHEVHVTDLYAEGFEPVMSAPERRAYHTAGINEAPVAAHLEALKWCEGLIFVYPTWWYGPPAMLKGWLERVFVPHATFSMPEDGKPIRGLLSNIRVLGAISTLGSPWWWWRVVMREPGRRILLTGIRVLCAPRCCTFWLAMHKLDASSDAQRRAFLSKVERRIGKLGGV